ncbi:hypothetical protein MMIC_P0823 [Mariprofundus micogutta]|uniref:Roadblock/LAMTOR2 domain-containing protein n=1 Tax=Mariprofundus micogutta TaxID=1921010 RepID=A0A1L8CLU6_9PROT|nr:hypothetical protein [Mariprofundus micogutta]GAV19865.1 hypothetical protein MMIC_P0823 [Mariprofundus micogutta]
MTEVGESPGEDFAPYSTSMMETSLKMSAIADLGNPICNALVLKGGRMLIMHEAKIDGDSIYLSILCSRVPTGVQTLIKKIVACLSRALTGNE